MGGFPWRRMRFQYTGSISRIVSYLNWETFDKTCQHSTGKPAGCQAFPHRFPPV